MKPILFNTEMVKAILGGRKTVTRRVVKMFPWKKDVSIDNTPCGEFYVEVHGMPTDIRLRPPYLPGDILYVRETWATWSPTYGTIPRIYYLADGKDVPGVKWRPSIHMPKEVARIFLRVTDVRAERLHRMTEDDARKEGCNCGPSCLAPYLSSFMYLWDSTVKHDDLDSYGWDANPWVWVIEFERCEKSDERRL